MSKKCCGIIYSDDEKVCKVCGKPLDKKNKKEKKRKKSDAELYEEEISDSYETIPEERVPDEVNEELPEESESDEADETLPEECVPDEADEELPEERTSDEEDGIHYSKNEADDTLQDGENKVDYLKKHIEREAILDQIFDDNGYKKNDVIKESKSKVPYKGAGIFTLILAILGIALIGVMVYFIIINPYYIKSGEANKQLDYPELVSDMDSYELSTPLEPYDATAADAVPETDE